MTTSTRALIRSGYRGIASRKAWWGTVCAAALLSITITAGLAQSAAPQRGGTLQIAHIANISSMDPQQVTAGFDLHLSWAVFDPVVDIDPKMNLVPGLAVSWKQTSPTTWEFKLRQGVKFHDGTPWDAQALKFNIERVQDPATKSPLRQNFLVIKSVDVVDQYTAKLTTERPVVTILQLLASRAAMQNSPTAVKKYGKDYGVTAAVGTGPFKFVRWQQGSNVTLERNPNYWRMGADNKPLPYLDKLVFNIVEDPTVRITNLKAGSADITYDVAPKDFAALEADSNFQVFKGPQTAVHMDYLSTSKPPFDNVHARRAMSYAIDRDAVAKLVYKGLAIPATGIISPALGPFYDSKLQVQKQDYEKAKEELKLAGMPNGFEFSAYNVPGEIYETQAQAQQAMLAKVGIKMNIRVADDPTISAFLANNAEQWQMNSDMTTGRADLDLLFTAFYYPGGGYNKGRLTGPGMDEVKALIESARSESDNAKRVKMYQQINDILERDAYDIHLFYPLQTAAANKKVMGFVLYADSATGHAWRDVWLSP
jgi:peptide/nickel transport system substrate-binding protein